MHFKQVSSESPQNGNSTILSEILQRKRNFKLAKVRVNEISPTLRSIKRNLETTKFGDNEHSKK